MKVLRGAEEEQSQVACLPSQLPQSVNACLNKIGVQMLFKLDGGGDDGLSVLTFKLCKQALGVHVCPTMGVHVCVKLGVPRFYLHSPQLKCHKPGLEK